jgi:hypothetical protein
MQGRDFLGVAVALSAGGAEAHWRSAVGRAYYALILERRAALLRWGFKIPPRDNMHTFVRLRFLYAAEQNLKTLGRALDRWVTIRNLADYDLSKQARFSSPAICQQAIKEMTATIALLDAIEADQGRRARAIAAIRQRFREQKP